MTASASAPNTITIPSIGQTGQKYPCPVIAQIAMKNSARTPPIPAVSARARLPRKWPTSEGRSAMSTNQPWMPSARASGSAAQIGQK